MQYIISRTLHSYINTLGINVIYFIILLWLVLVSGWGIPYPGSCHLMQVASPLGYVLGCLVDRCRRVMVRLEWPSLWSWNHCGVLRPSHQLVLVWFGGYRLSELIILVVRSVIIIPCDPVTSEPASQLVSGLWRVLAQMWCNTWWKCMFECCHVPTQVCHPFAAPSLHSWIGLASSYEDFPSKLFVHLCYLWILTSIIFLFN